MIEAIRGIKFFLILFILASAFSEKTFPSDRDIILFKNPLEAIERRQDLFSIEEQQRSIITDIEFGGAFNYQLETSDGSNIWISTSSIGRGCRYIAVDDFANRDKDFLDWRISEKKLEISKSDRSYQYFVNRILNAGVFENVPRSHLEPVGPRTLVQINASEPAVAREYIVTVELGAEGYSNIEDRSSTEFMFDGNVSVRAGNFFSSRKIVGLRLLDVKHVRESRVSLRFYLRLPPELDVDADELVLDEIFVFLPSTLSVIADSEVSLEIASPEDGAIDIGLSSELTSPNGFEGQIGANKIIVSGDRSCLSQLMKARFSMANMANSEAFGDSFITKLILTPESDSKNFHKTEVIVAEPKQTNSNGSGLVPEYTKQSPDIFQKLNNSGLEAKIVDYLPQMKLHETQLFTTIISNLQGIGYRNLALNEGHQLYLYDTELDKFFRLPPDTDFINNDGPKKIMVILIVPTTSRNTDLVFELEYSLFNAGISANPSDQLVPIFESVETKVESSSSIVDACFGSRFLLPLEKSKNILVTEPNLYDFRVCKSGKLIKITSVPASTLSQLTSKPLFYLSLPFHEKKMLDGLHVYVNDNIHELKWFRQSWGSRQAAALNYKCRPIYSFNNIFDLGVSLEKDAWTHRFAWMSCPEDVEDFKLRAMKFPAILDQRYLDQQIKNNDRVEKNGERFGVISIVDDFLLILLAITSIIILRRLKLVRKLFNYFIAVFLIFTVFSIFFKQNEISIILLNIWYFLIVALLLEKTYLKILSSKDLLRQCH